MTTFRSLTPSVAVCEAVLDAAAETQLLVVSPQSPGQYYFKPMMKEFRFEPSSQMIEVQEGQNLKITVTGYRTAYRYAARLSLSCRPGLWSPTRASATPDLHPACIQVSCGRQRR